MPLVKGGKITVDPLIHVADDGELPGEGAILVSAARFLGDVSFCDGRVGFRAHQISRRGFDECSTEPLFPIIDAARELMLHIFHEFVDFALHLFHFSTHVENDLDACEVDTQISGECQNCFELLEIFL